MDEIRRKEPSLKARPKIKQLYWCRFPKDNEWPEFGKIRPVIILSFKNKLYGAVTVIPCSTLPQDENHWAYKLKTTIDGRDAWAVCDKPTTVAVSRLIQHKYGINQLMDAEFNEILSLVLAWLPKPR